MLLTAPASLLEMLLPPRGPLVADRMSGRKLDGLVGRINTTLYIAARSPQGVLCTAALWNGRCVFSCTTQPSEKVDFIGIITVITG
eukprot:COSAG02_NODE_754_length_17578_cov_97.544825_10_plen_86_part_00